VAQRSVGERVVLCLVDRHCLVGVLAGLGGGRGGDVVSFVFCGVVIGFVVCWAEECEEGRGGCGGEEAEMNLREGKWRGGWEV